MTHIIEVFSCKEGIDKELIPFCSCGWKGTTHFAHNDYQYTNVQDEIVDHLKTIPIGVESSVYWRKS